MLDSIRDSWDWWTETPERGWLFFRWTCAVNIVGVAVAGILLATGRG